MLSKTTTLPQVLTNHITEAYPYSNSQVLRQSFTRQVSTNQCKYPVLFLKNNSRGQNENSSRERPAATGNKTLHNMSNAINYDSAQAFLPI